MKKKRASKTPKSRRPLYYVDNPNNLELKWLDDMQKSKAKEISVHGSAALAQQPAKQTADQAESKQGRVNGNAKSGGGSLSQSVPNTVTKESVAPETTISLSSEFVSTTDEAEEIIAIATALPPANELPAIAAAPQDIVAVVESLQSENLQLTDTLVAMLNDEVSESESLVVNVVEEPSDKEARHSRLEEKRMPSRPAPIVYTDDIADEAITGEKLAPFAIDAMHLAADSVATNSLADFSVTAIKLADGSVTSSKIAP